MVRNPTDLVDGLELVLLNRSVMPGFSFGYRRNGRTEKFVLIDQNVIYLNNSLRALKEIYLKRLQEIAGPDFYVEPNQGAAG